MDPGYSEDSLDLEEDLQEELDRLLSEVERKKGQIRRRRVEKEGLESDLDSDLEDSLSQIDERLDELKRRRFGLEKEGSQTDQELDEIEHIDRLMSDLRSDRREKRFRHEDLVSDLESVYRSNVEDLEDEIAELEREVQEVLSSIELLD